MIPIICGSEGETLQGVTSGATAKIYSVEYTGAVRNEED